MMKKSRIPVPITKQKSSKLCNDEEKSEIKSNLLKKQALDANKTSNLHSIQKRLEKKIGSHLEKSKKLTKCNKNPDVKNKLVPSITNKKCNIAKASEKKFERSSKLNDKNKYLTYETNTKPNLTNKRVTNVLQRNINIDKRKILPSVESEIKPSSTEDKKENLPSPICYSFEEEICTPVGKLIASKQDCFENENVEFEANEIYRKMILSNAMLSPSVRKLLPNLRLSSLQSERPSVYKKFQIPNDPLKEALKALENTCLSAKRIKKENNLTRSPRKEFFRDSIYTPRGDPNEEFLRKLESFKLKQLQRTVPKSTKKVTFNLDIHECTPKNSCDVQHGVVENSEKKLIQINEKSKENTPNSPQSVKSDEFTSHVFAKHEHNILNETLIVDEKDKPTKVDHNDVISAESNKTKTAGLIFIASKGNQRLTKPVIPDESTYQNKETFFQTFKENSCRDSSPIFFCDKKDVEKHANCLKDNNMQPSPQKIIKQNAKVYTPKPISLSSNPKICESYSPEFLVDRKSIIMTNLAPICTPLVLKSQAKNTMFSPEIENGPIPLKLDFTEEEKDSPKKQTCKNHSLFPLDNIVTIQKQLDYLADQECLLSLINENFPVICGRYLMNPVARTLNEGDDMHFIPIQF